MALLVDRITVADLTLAGRLGRRSAFPPEPAKAGSLKMTTRSLLQELRARFAEALNAVAGDSTPVDPQVRASGDPKFGDYQCNAAMALAGRLKRKPRDVAQAIVDAVEVADLAEPLEIAGPGFINIRLKPESLSGRLGRIAPVGEGGVNPNRPELTDRFGIPPVADGDRLRVILDYSSPNVAKQMHVGHLRSTIIGDVFARSLEFAGHDVIRQNHVGDWGTAMGMVILGLWYRETRRRRGETDDVLRRRLVDLQSARESGVDERRALLQPIATDWAADLSDANAAVEPVRLEQLELGYQFVQTLTTVAEKTGVQAPGPDGDIELADIPRLVTQMLQTGGEGNEFERALWEAARAASIGYCQELYDRLGVLLRPEDVRGESFYHARLPRVVDDLRTALTGEGRTAPDGAKAVFREDQGAACVFVYEPDGKPRYANPDGEALPLIVQKSDGAFLYATTDLAALRYRVSELHGQRLIYVTDPRQQLHFKMFFDVGRAMGWAAPTTRLEHVTFGSVLGENRRPLKTREGGVITLARLLDEAESRAFELLHERQRAAESEEEGAAIPRFDEVEMREVARRIGIASIKYADLCRDRNSDYVFSWDKMLAFQGNTAPYMLYAYARIRSIYRRAADEFPDAQPYAADVTIQLDHPTERALALRLARLPETLESIVDELTPHTLCAYLFDLAADFMRFYEACSVLKAPDAASRASRLRLCDLTARGLRLGLSLLGIPVIERM
ncbi:MAG: arginine--tRNA ligase [Phycisphaerales bacterium]|nr:arginine--tRNA ligase [Phycisphaerales bacterium]